MSQYVWSEIYLFPTISPATLCLLYVFTVLYCNTKAGNLMAKSNPATMTLMPFWIQMLQKDINRLPERIKISESGMASDLRTLIYLLVLTPFNKQLPRVK